MQSQNALPQHPTLPQTATPPSACQVLWRPSPVASSPWVSLPVRGADPLLQQPWEERGQDALFSPIGLLGSPACHWYSVLCHGCGDKPLNTEINNVNPSITPGYLSG